MRYSPSAPRTVRGVLIFFLATGAGALTGCSPANDGGGGMGGAGGVGGSGGVGGTGGAPSSSGSGGVDGGAASGGAPGSGTGGSAGQGGGAGGSGGPGGSGGTVVEPPGVTDGGTPPVDAPAMPIAGQRILLNMLSTGYVHTSEVPASRVLRDKLTALGFTVQIAEDPALFSDAGLAPFKVVVMVQASGEPAGPAAGVDALIRWIRAGGGLVGFHGATILSYPTAGPYVQMIGGKFVSHPGGVRRASCDSVGTHPSIAKLAKPFVITDEIYVHTGLNPMNQVVLTCPADGGGAPLPISWYRNEGTGRVFYTALGNGGELWTATSPLVNDHVVPAILWAAGQQ